MAFPLVKSWNCSKLYRIDRQISRFLIGDLLDLAGNARYRPEGQKGAPLDDQYRKLGVS
jgi:hypothetical protein